MEEAPMAEPIVFISRWRIVEGKREAVEETFAQAVGFIASSKPRTALYAAYEDEMGDELRIVHAMADPAALTHHFVGSEQRSASIEGMIQLLGFEVYGNAPADTVEQLRREAAAAGAELKLLPRAVGGYLRPPA
jgi:hypothetical protein